MENQELANDKPENLDSKKLNLNEINFDDWKKPELEELKLKFEINNLKDNGLTSFEKILKKRVIPLFVPIITVIATGLYFYIGKKEADKAKAYERYKNEMEIVKIAWKQVIEDENLKNPSIGTRRSIDLLANIYVSNKKSNENDYKLLGIPLNKRPIYLLSNTNALLKYKLAKIDYDVLKGYEAKKDVKKINPNLPIVDQKEGSMSAAKKLKLNSNSYTVFIQYKNRDNISEVSSLVYKLGYFYLVSDTELIEKDYQNEIRYYEERDKTKALELQAQLKEITGLDFKLNFLNHKVNSSVRVLEIWFNNS